MSQSPPGSATRRFQYVSVNVADRFRHLAINTRQGFKQREPKIAQSHADLVVHGGLGLPNFVALPKRGNLGMDDLFATQGFAWGEGKTIEPLQFVGDAATLQQITVCRATSVGWGVNTESR